MTVKEFVPAAIVPVTVPPSEPVPVAFESVKFTAVATGLAVFVPSCACTVTLKLDVFGDATDVITSFVGGATSTSVPAESAAVVVSADVRALRTADPFVERSSAFEG